MAWLDVYRADVSLGPHIRGEVYSYHPIPDGEFPLPQPDGSEVRLEVAPCNRFVIEAPGLATLRSNEVSGDAAVDPDHPDGSVAVGPRVVFDRAHGHREDFRLLRTYWQYGKNREAADRFEAHLRAHAEAKPQAPANES